MKLSPPDAPESSRERDALGRWTLAATIYELIRSSPLDWCLRIGVYGHWGEGKTTVLKFIEELVDSEIIIVTWFNPWSAQDRNQLWNNFYLAIGQALKPPLHLRIKNDLARLLKWGTEWGEPVAQLHPVGKVFQGIAGRLAQRLSIKKSDAEVFIKEHLRKKKLLVFIDDLDRARPDLVPHLLLALREVFDLRQCVFVLALDPEVVAKALPSVHPGWGTTPEFLEKIIDFPFWLSPNDKSAVLRLANEQLASCPLTVNREALREVVDLLPQNPRKLKLFFRRLWRLKTVLDRHGPDEIEWILIFHFELIRIVSMRILEALMGHKTFWQDVMMSQIPEGKDKDEYEDQWMKKLHSMIADLHTDSQEIEEQRMIGLIKSLRDKTSILAKQNFRYWARITEDPPSVTWKEFREFLEQWKANPSTTTLTQYAEEHAAKILSEVSTVYKELFNTLIDYRHSVLSRAADSDTDDQLQEEMASAGTALSCISAMVCNLHVFSKERIGLGCAEFTLLFNHFSRWAHFTNHKLYSSARKIEEEILVLGARDSGKFGAEFLEDLRVWMGSRGENKEAIALKELVIMKLLPFIAEDLLNRFSRKDGISSLWGKDSHLVEKYFLFGRDNGFYTSPTLASFELLHKRAKDDQNIQVNFLEFIRLLSSGFTHGLSALTRDELLPLARDMGLVGMAWSAATTRRLQPRVIKSLMEDRAVLASQGGSDTHLPIPAWLEKETPIRPGEEPASHD